MESVNGKGTKKNSSPKVGNGNWRLESPGMAGNENGNEKKIWTPGILKKSGGSGTQTIPTHENEKAKTCLTFKRSEIKRSPPLFFIVHQ